MSDIMEDILNNIEILDTQTYNNMTVIGLNVPDNNVDLMSLEIGLDMGLVEIKELDEAGSVGEVKVVNNAVTPLLLLDGEEIIGSKQNRIVNATIIIPAKSERIIPVSCVEEGRWAYNTTKFHYSNHMATSRVRRDKQTSVNNSLRNERLFKSDQGKVWSNVRDTLYNLNVKSDTNALHDTYNQRKTQLESYKKAFKSNDNQNGLIVYVNGELAGFEIIYNSTRYKEYHEKIIESYVMDALLRQNEDCVKEDFSKEDLIQKIMQTPRESYDSVGEGVDYRIEDEDITGSVVLYNNKLVNASFFRKSDA